MQVTNLLVRSVCRKIVFLRELCATASGQNFSLLPILYTILADDRLKAAIYSGQFAEAGRIFLSVY
jgi:hypothetical protein